MNERRKRGKWVTVILLVTALMTVCGGTVMWSLGLPAQAADDATTAGHSVTVTPGPALSLVKGATASEIRDAKVGDTLTWTFKVTNTGDMAINDASIDDPLLGDGSKVTLDKTVLAPGESAEGRIDYVLTQDDLDAGGVTN